MVALYAVVLVIGVLATVGWVAASVAAGPPWELAHPAERFGRGGRRLVTAVLGFGLAGMSASYGGWSPGLAVVGAIGGAVLLTGCGEVLDPVEAEIAEPEIAEAEIADPETGEPRR